MDADWDADPLNSPLFLRMLAVGSGLPVSPAHTQPCYTDSFSPIPLTCSLHAWPRLALSIPRGKGGSATVPQATFLSLTKEGRRPSLPVWPWVVTDTGFQLLTKNTGRASGHTASQWLASSQPQF